MYSRACVGELKELRQERRSVWRRVAYTYVIYAQGEEGGRHTNRSWSERAKFDSYRGNGEHRKARQESDFLQLLGHPSALLPIFCNLCHCARRAVIVICASFINDSWAAAARVRAGSLQFKFLHKESGTDYVHACYTCIIHAIALLLFLYLPCQVQFFRLINNNIYVLHVLSWPFFIFRIRNMLLYCLTLWPFHVDDWTTMLVYRLNNKYKF